MAIACTFYRILDVSFHKDGLGFALVAWFLDAEAICISLDNKMGTLEPRNILGVNET